MLGLASDRTAQARVPYPLMSEYFDLGGYGRQVTTDSAEAQVWFDRGLVWAYAFNHEEAAACFERAAEADPGHLADLAGRYGLDLDLASVPRLAAAHGLRVPGAPPGMS